MIRYSFKIAIRNLIRSKSVTFTNIAGLSIGIACCILVFIYGYDELSYDRFNKNYNNIYRLLDIDAKSGQRGADHTINLLPVIKQQIPGIEKGSRVQLKSEVVIGINNNQFLSEICYVEPDFFDIFSIPAVTGNVKKEFAEPYAVAITETFAKKHFGSKNPVGSEIILNNKQHLTVKGILKDIPKQSHLNFDMMVSYQTILANADSIDVNFWGNTSVNIYFLIKNKNAIPSIQNGIKTILKQNCATCFENNYELQPLKDIYLRSVDVTWDDIAKGDMKVVLSFIIIAIFILFIASFNYINLSTAEFQNKTKITAIQKTFGASRLKLIFQFYVETFLICLCAVNIAIILTELALPWFNQCMGKELEMNFQTNYLLLLITGLFLLLVLFSGSYPAFFLTRFKVVEIFRSQILQPSTSFMGRLSSFLFSRKILITLQFIISIALIVSSIIIIMQFRLISEQKLGYIKEGVIVIHNPEGENPIRRFNLFKERIKQSPAVINISVARNVPTYEISNYVMVNVKGHDEKPIQSGRISIDCQYFNLLGTKFTEGRNFADKFSTDKNAVIINQTLAKELGIKKPVGQIIKYWGEEHEVIGIANDIQFTSLYHPIKPAIFNLISDRGFRKILVKLETKNLQGTLKLLEKEWDIVAPDWPFQFSFIENRIKDLYKSELRTLNIIRILTVLAILLSCMGIFGIASYLVRRRTKEIGIRKVNGAKTIEIMLMLSKDFTKWVVIAFIIACPTAYFAMHQWLQSFAYKTELSLWIFAIAGLSALTVALLTVSWQAWRAASRNPVESLRYE